MSIWRFCQPPKILQGFFQFGRIADPAMGKPLPGKQLAIAGAAETLINQDNHAAVGFGSNHPSGGLEDLVHAGVEVGIFIAGVVLLIKIIADDVALKSDLG